MRHLHHADFRFILYQVCDLVNTYEALDFMIVELQKKSGFLYRVMYFG